MLAQTVGNVLIWLTAIPAVLSVVVYARSPWWKSSIGRHLMSYMAVIAAVLTLSVARDVFGDSEGFRVLRLVVFAGVPVVMWWRLVILIKTRREGD